jgi:hypothetical protein
LDLEYLLSLGPDSYPDLVDYVVKNKINNADLLSRLYDKASAALSEWEENQLYYSWRSYNYNDAVLFKQLSVSLPAIQTVTGNMSH